ncbi:MAG TPA: hypothetical protein V6D15_15990 [Oculatellaceae cyanobacterium]|jgi:hypothetical protein
MVNTTDEIDERWLTPEEAVEIGNLSISPHTLRSYPSRSESKESAEEKFQKVGLLFNRELWRQNQPFLKLITAPNEVTDLPDKDDDENDNNEDEVESEATNNEINESNSATQENPKELTFDNCKIIIQIVLYPSSAENDNSSEGLLNRDVLISVGNEGDFPLGRKVHLSDITENLPSVITEMLSELKQSMPARNVRQLLRNSQTNKKPTRLHSQSSLTKPSISQPDTVPLKSTIQLSLF